MTRLIVRDGNPHVNNSIHEVLLANLTQTLRIKIVKCRGHVLQGSKASTNVKVTTKVSVSVEGKEQQMARETDKQPLKTNRSQRQLGKVVVALDRQMSSRGTKVDLLMITR